MGRVFGILLIVLGVWAAAELYTQGVDGAFGGVFSQGSDSEAAQAPPTKRAGEAVNRAFRQSEDRVDRALEHASQ